MAPYGNQTHNLSRRAAAHTCFKDSKYPNPPWRYTALKCTYTAGTFQDGSVMCRTPDVSVPSVPSIIRNCPSHTSTYRMFIRDNMKALWEEVQANVSWNWFNGFVVKNKNSNQNLFTGSFYNYSVLCAIDLCCLTVLFLFACVSCLTWKVTDVSGKEEQLTLRMAFIYIIRVATTHPNYNSIFIAPLKSV